MYGGGGRSLSSTAQGSSLVRSLPFPSLGGDTTDGILIQMGFRTYHQRRPRGGVGWWVTPRIPMLCCVPTYLLHAPSCGSFRDGWAQHNTAQRHMPRIPVDFSSEASPPPPPPPTNPLLLLPSDGWADRRVLRIGVQPRRRHGRQRVPGERRRVGMHGGDPLPGGPSDLPVLRGKPRALGGGEPGGARS